MVKLWKNANETFSSHSKGLSEDQARFLQSFKTGERLIIFTNDDGTLVLRKSFYSGKSEKKAEEQVEAEQPATDEDSVE